MVVSTMGLVSGALAATPSAGAPAAMPAVAAATSHASGSTLPSVPSNHASAAVPSAPASIPAPPTPLEAKTAASSQAASTLQSLESRGVPLHDIYLPDYAAADHAPSSGVVQLSYGSGPAPWGIGEFGLRNVSGVITPFTLTTTKVAASFSTGELTGLSPDISGPDQYGVQVNAVLNNVTIEGSHGYQFWTQNVFDFYPALHQIVFVSNIWNFSAIPIACNTFYSTDGNFVCPVYYYGESALMPASYPFTVNFWMNSSLIGGRDAVFFNYSVNSGAGVEYGSFNYAIFNSLAPGGNPAATPVPAYVATGSAYNPIGLLDDMEIMIGGPGGGSNFDLLGAESTYMTLQYFNDSADAFQNVPSAYNVGGDTGETSYGVSAAWSSFATNPGYGPAACAACALLTAGPSLLRGMWNVSAAPQVTDWVDQPYLVLTTNSYDPFMFVAPGAVFTGWQTTDWSLFQWAPGQLAPDSLYNLGPELGLVLPTGEYTVIFLQANYDPLEVVVDLTSGAYFHQYAMTPDTTTGVYTPLWAQNETAAGYVASGIDGFGNYLLMNNQYADVGSIPCFSDFGCASFPFFGTANDYLYPIFPGVMLNDVEEVDIVNPPSFQTALLPLDALAVAFWGVPSTNDLQFFINDSYDVNFLGGSVGGWWLYASYYGPLQSLGSVTYWNTSDSYINGVTFDGAGMGLFLYGGYDNEIVNCSFYTSIPSSPDPYATLAAYWGGIGLVDADWGDAGPYGAAGAYECDYCDAIYNNIFDTFVTATSLVYDPYTGSLPALFPYAFSEAWNVAYTPGVTNIIGGDYLGGNYWWDYGYYWNPYNVLPDVEFNPIVELEFGVPAAFICMSVYFYCDYGGGDYYPLVPQPVYQMTFKEVGLPAGVSWGVSIYVEYTSGSEEQYDWQTGYVENETLAPGEVNLSETAGAWEYYPYTSDPYLAAANAVALITDASIVVTVVFQKAYVLNVTESGLPAHAYWEAYAFGGPNEEYFGEVENTSSILLVGLLPGDYTLYAVAEGNWYATTESQSITIVAANVSASVAFIAAYVLTVHETGLPADSGWEFSYTSATGGYSGTWIIFGASELNVSLPALNYTWSALAPGYTAVPASGSAALTGNTTLSITFGASASLVFTASGLPGGTPWTVALTEFGVTTYYTTTAGSLTIAVAAGSVSYAISSAGFTATPSSGIASPGAGATTEVAVSFAAPTGTLSGTISTGGATLYVDGAKEVLGSGGSFSVTLPAGVHTVEVTASGYQTYFNNVSVSAGKTTTLSIALTATPSTGLAGISSLGWILIALLAAIAVILLVTTLVFARRGRRPPPPTPYAASP
ncbi:MAG TPA: thermopsin family protease, partial [Thermoplasmata archaeon]|nr:thermopsin family protease [Thermoplasmata archaeon]